MRSTKHDAPGSSFDADTVMALKQILREEFETVLQSFFRNTHSYVEQIRTGIVQNDRAIVKHASHKLAASAGQMGFVKVSWLARTIEDNVATEDLLSLMSVHIDLSEACAQAMADSQTICQQD